MPQDNQEANLIKFREELIDALDALAPEQPHVSAEILQTFLEMRSRVNHSVSKIGNNLRILRRKGVVEYERMGGHKFWSLTGKPYIEEGIVRVLVAFPKPMHDDIVMFRKLGGRKKPLSKTAFIVNMVGIGLRSLDPLRKEIDFSTRSEAPAPVQPPPPPTPCQPPTQALGQPPAQAQPPANVPGQRPRPNPGQPPAQAPGEPGVPKSQ